MDTAPSSVRFISPEQLAARIGKPDAPLILDLRSQARFSESPFMLAAARHCTPDDIEALAAAGPAREVVVYCAHGHQRSQDAAARLNQAGWNAHVLAGGMEGGEDGVDTPDNIGAWRAHPKPLVRKRADLGVTGECASRWVTRERPKIDRIACPWLVRRFIDPRAEFFYVPADCVLLEATRLGAIAYDIAGAPVTHVGDECSFDALLAAFALRDPALDRLATIVRAADTAQLRAAPQAAGLLAVSLGLSMLHTDDQAMLAAAMPVYDALYAWCRDGQDEHHSWAVAGATAAAL